MNRPRTAAWRFSTLTTVAFAAATAVVFLIFYATVARGIRERSDAWLKGETELLVEVADSSAPGDINQRLMAEVAELAQHEVTGEEGHTISPDQPIFSLISRPDGVGDLWIGPPDRERFIAVLGPTQAETRGPWSITVPGWAHDFRVVARPTADGGTVFLGFVDQEALRLLVKIRTLFVSAWLGMAAFGFLVSWISARRILARVDGITNTATQIGSEDFSRRVPEVKGRDEISRLARTFNDMLGRIEASVRSLRTVSDGLAHDLRSPLTSIRGNLEMAVTEGNPEHLRNAAVASIDGMDRLQRLVNSSLDIAEAEAGAIRLDRRHLDLEQLAREMVMAYQASAEERGLVLAHEGHGAVTAWVDRDLTCRALANLLDNAVMHLPPGCQVVVKARRLPDRAVIQVADDGPGFPPEMRERVFERFARGPSSRGFGIGLSLVRAAARAHGGDAGVESPAGGGAIVTVSFPAETPPSQDPRV